MNPSVQHSNWITVGEVIRLVKKPVAAYADHIVKRFHAKLRRDCQPLGQCSNPTNCLNKKKPNDLCRSCNGWYQEALSLRNAKKSQIKWRQNCDSSKWHVDAWEVAKFFMSVLGNNKSNVQDAESTDLSSLLNVLERMEDVAFGGDKRVDLKLVKNLRSDVRNSWAHAPKQEMTEDELNKVFEIANKFLGDLYKVFAHVEINKCMNEIQSLQANGLTDVIETDLKNLVLLRRELWGDVSQMKEDIKSLKQDQNSDSLVIHENEEKLKNLEDFTEECSSRIEDFQKWKENLDKLFSDVKLELDSFREETRRNIGGMRADIKELQDANNSRGAVEIFEPKSCIPEKLSTFVGREKEISAIKSSLVKGHGTVSLVGGPGIGKSSIAVEVSHRLSEEHGIPVIFSYLSTTSTVAEVVRRLCLDVGVQPGEDPNSSLMVWLRNINRRVVLVLDNVEQLLEGGTNLQEFLNLLRLLRKDSSQFLQIITTSRKSYHVPDLKRKSCPVEAMDAESSMELLKKLCPQKDLNYDNLIKMIDLCGHMPLALRLLSFRINDTEDPEKMLEWLQVTPMEVLQTPAEKVRKTIEKSFEILQSEEKRHFVRLSMLEGNFNREAAQHVTELVEIKTESVLAEFVQRCLLQRSGENYAVHPLIRSYLTEIEKFAEDRKRAQELMVEHFLRKCHELTLLYWSKDGSNAARKALEEILHHVEKVLKICEEASSETNPCTNSVIVDTLVNSEIYKSSSRFFYHFILHFLLPVMVRNFLEFCAKLAKNRKDVVAEVNFQCLLADEIGRSVGWKSEEYNECMELVKLSFDQIEPNQQENSELSHFYYCYGRYLFNRKCRDAKKSLLKSLKIRQSEIQAGTEKNQKQTAGLGKIDQALTLTLLGKVCKLADKDAGTYYYHQALTKSKQCLGHDHELTLNCYKQLGDLELEKHDYEKALEYYDTAKGIHKVLTEGITDASISSVFFLKNRGSCLFNLGRYKKAVDDFKEACGILEKRREDNNKCKFQVYSYLAEALNKQLDNRPEAAEYAEKALQVFSKIDKLTINNWIFIQKSKMEAIIGRRRQQDGY